MVSFCDKNTPFPFPNKQLGQALGQSDSAGTAMSQWVLVDTGKVILVLAAQKLTKTEFLDSEELAKRESSDCLICDKFSLQLTAPNTPVDYKKLYKDKETP